MRLPGERWKGGARQMSQSTDAAPSMFRLREGWMAALFLLGATLSLLFITRTDVVNFSPQEHLYLATAGLLALTIPGPLLRPWDLPAQLFFWNSIGWGIGLVVFVLASFGALPIPPRSPASCAHAPAPLHPS